MQHAVIGDTAGQERSLHRTTIAGRRHTTMTDIPWIVSLDDHVVEPPDVWTSACPRSTATSARTS